MKSVFRVTDTKSDLEVGGKWSNEGVTPDGRHFHLEGEYLEIDPPRLLVHTRIADFVGNIKTIVRWELEPRDVHGLHGTGSHRMGTGTLVKCGTQASQAVSISSEATTKAGRHR